MRRSPTHAPAVLAAAAALTLGTLARLEILGLLRPSIIAALLIATVLVLVLIALFRALQTLSAGEPYT